MRHGSSTGAVWPRSEKEAGSSAGAVVKLPCRICHCSEETRSDPLVAPCGCDGSLRYVHNSCQQAWLRARRGPLDYHCELCRGRLACRLTWSVRVELIVVSLTSVTVWVTQVMSVVTVARLMLRSLLIWRTSPGRPGVGPTLPGSLLLKNAAKLFPAPATDPASCDGLADRAIAHLVLMGIVVFVAHNALHFFRRPLCLFFEEALSRICMVKIGGCVLVLLHEVLWAFPPTQRFAPLPAWKVIGATLLLDTFLLAFLRVPREERCGRIALRVTHLACRISGDFLPFAAIFFLWSAFIVMIAAASLVPCAALLFHEAVRDVWHRRHRHGSVQLVTLVARAAVRLALLGFRGPSPVNTAWVWCDGHLVTAWLTVEVCVLLDLVTIRRGICCARDTASQAMWLLAVIGQAAFAGHDCLRGNGLGAAPASGGGSTTGGGRWRGMCRGHAATARGGSAAARQQDAAILLMLACYLVIHVPVFARNIRRLREAILRVFTRVDPAQVVFYDRVPSL
eukprot:CAMPEP_0117556990 /NCGR_PEP_ID=MMETSP0784-20121206/52096_1 /TAXON_ID=39447 /ORGANISM="" /LENGTH=508 /DNA_ID=CAMNT_0005354287 /DNA_START=12 /DNA_END=1535 /DNA_ORIENTATION=-